MKPFLLSFTLVFNGFLFAQDYNYLKLDDVDDFSDMSILKDETSQYNFYFSGENHMFSTSNSQLEFKLLKYLHQNEGVKNLVLEFGEGTGWIVNQYVHQDNDEIEEVIENQFHDDYGEFFKKVKEYNETLDSANKITVTGIDLQRSYYIGIEALYLQLPDDSIKPHDSIAREIELLRFLKGYVRDKVDRGEYESSSVWNFNGVTYSIPNSLKTLASNFTKHKAHYTNYLGDRFNDYEVIFNCIIKAKEFKNYEGERNPYASMYREDYMFKKLSQLVDLNKGEKFYGQFGRAHISNERASYEKYGTYNFASLVSKINSSPKEFFKNKVMSIGIYYINRQDSYMDLDHETDLAYTFKDMKNGGVAIENVKDYPTLDSIIKKSHQFVVVHNKTIREETNYVNSTFKSGVEFWVGAHQMELGNLNTYFGSDFNNIPHQHWGFSLYAYGDQSIYVDYAFNFYTTKNSNINDTINLDLNGWNGFLNIGYDITKTGVIDIIPMLGIGYQNMKIQVTEKNYTGYTGIENVVQYDVTNPAFMLNSRLDLRLKIIPGISLVAKGGYLLDVSKPDWRFNKLNIGAENKFSGLYWRAGIAIGSN